MPTWQNLIAVHGRELDDVDPSLRALTTNTVEKMAQVVSSRAQPRKVVAAVGFEMAPGAGQLTGAPKSESHPGWHFVSELVKRTAIQVTPPQP